MVREDPHLRPLLRGSSVAAEQRNVAGRETLVRGRHHNELHLPILQQVNVPCVAFDAASLENNFVKDFAETSRTLCNFNIIPFAAWTMSKKLAVKVQPREEVTSE
jgi:hypothetical protein